MWKFWIRAGARRFERRAEEEEDLTQRTQRKNTEITEKTSWEIVGCHGPSTPRPDAPQNGAEEKSGRSGPFGFAQGRRDDRVRKKRKREKSGDRRRGLNAETRSAQRRGETEKRKREYALRIIRSG